MTREDAIKILQGERWYMSRYSEEYKEAYNMAIEALNSVTDSENDAVESKDDVIKNLDDTISRQDAIEAVRNSEVLLAYDSEWSCDVLAESAIEQTRGCLTYALKALPSAKAVQVVRCKDCRHADECHKSVQYTRNEPITVTIGYTKIDFCSHGERREG